MALLTANLRSESERCWTHGAHGLDSVSYRFRPSHPGTIDRKLRGWLHSLGVEPSAWGRNVAKRLLHELKLVLRAHGYQRGELWVYEDNPAAIGLYTVCGWQLLGKTQTHPTSGRIEQRYFLDLSPRSPSLPIDPPGRA